MAVVYPALGLAGESGEAVEKVKKMVRLGASFGFVGETPVVTAPPENLQKCKELRDGLMLELGDVLWYISSIADDCGWTLEMIAQANLDKLNSRKERGVIKGEGDQR